MNTWILIISYSLVTIVLIGCMLAIFDPFDKIVNSITKKFMNKHFPIMNFPIEAHVDSKGFVVQDEN